MLTGYSFAYNYLFPPKMQGQIESNIFKKFLWFKN